VPGTRPDLPPDFFFPWSRAKECPLVAGSAGTDAMAACGLLYKVALIDQVCGFPDVQRGHYKLCFRNLEGAARKNLNITPPSEYYSSRG
jgi:hypothetical protein